MRITPQAVNSVRTCAICERTLLVGERSVRYTPDGEGFVDVCPLCQDVALEYGWIKEGSPTTPVVADRRRRRRGLAWDISWYQYRVSPESAQPVRLAERGHEPRELESMFTSWNAKLTRDGRIAPDISPV